MFLVYQQHFQGYLVLKFQKCPHPSCKLSMRIIRTTIHVYCVNVMIYVMELREH